MVECSVVAAEAQRKPKRRAIPPNHAPVFPFNHPSPGPPDVSYNSFMTIFADVPQFAALLFQVLSDTGVVTWRRTSP